MKKVIFLLISLSTITNCFSKENNIENYKICFTPKGHCTEMIVHEINKAKDHIYIEAYSFTSKPIIESLLEAKKNHIEVTIILDKSQINNKNSLIKLLVNKGIKVFVDYKPAIAHNKIVMIDNNIVITGSFNFTKAAQYKNAENIIILYDKEIASIYKNNWQERLSNSIAILDYKKKANHKE